MKQIVITVIIFLSAIKKERVHTLLEEVEKVYDNFNRRVQTSVLNDVLMDAVLLNQPPIFNGNRLRLTYATQDDVMPPSFVLFVNDERHMHFSYLRYLENQFEEFLNGKVAIWNDETTIWCAPNVPEHIATYGVLC